MNEEATIRRGVRNARYSTIPNHVFEDTRLSMAARWLLGYLLSKPDNWTVIVGDVAKKGGCGRDKARTMIKELVDCGYAEKDQAREGGRFGAMSLVIYDEPTGGVASLPQTEKPSTVNPSTVKPSTVNPTLVNTDDQVITDDKVERECASEDEGREGNAKALERSFFRLVKGWPGSQGMPTGEARKLWADLTEEDRQTAQRRRDAWFNMLRSQSKKHFPAPSTYLKDRLWTDIPDEAPAAKPISVEARPFGPTWAIERFRRLLAGPQDLPMFTFIEKQMIAANPDREAAMRREKQIKLGWPFVNRMHEMATQRQGVMVLSALDDLKPLVEAVPVASELFDSWKTFHESKGWPWIPDPGNQPVVYFPVGGPERLKEFEQAIRGTGNDGDR
ncbi:hypothetical protein SAMN05428967_4457 [Phyllobacterium sp. YR620]|uniref:helix-turn-helix domain-containing protein n=1 Tax=Phyllobacterium sp. YR620 TaxID=1881066 RepID=UPI0008831819|nr:helix-turn-helix domain-containing protein [Phyllobacterium sp. YR620]SDP92410.1 hypothetical protein SAMN05428967_4457 [Phyllobacterium sp. YR620]